MGKSNGQGIKVLLVDDHAVVRQGLQRILERDEGIKVVGEASNGEEAVSKAMALLPDVITMDLKMPGMDGITATREIKQKTHGVNILMLTLYSEDFVREAIEAGASGYMLKDSDCEQLIQAIHQVYEGFIIIAPILMRGLTHSLRHSLLSTVSLTERELEILTLVSDGIRNKEISLRLFISSSTVKREVRHIFDKLGVSDRAHAVAIGIRRRLLKSPSDLA
jgi:DNA-binding NarL/FixJ family response regulator